jgi:hypothetical protein
MALRAVLRLALAGDQRDRELEILVAGTHSSVHFLC